MAHTQIEHNVWLEYVLQRSTASDKDEAKTAGVMRRVSKRPFQIEFEIKKTGV